MSEQRESLIYKGPGSGAEANLVDAFLGDGHLRDLVDAIGVPECEDLLRFVTFARTHSERFHGDENPDAPLQFIKQLANADPHRARVITMLTAAGVELTGEYAEVARALVLMVRDDPMSVRKRDGQVFRVVGFSPENIKNLGGSRKSASATWNGILVRELAGRVPENYPKRYSALAALGALCGAGPTFSRQWVRSVLKR